MPCKKGKSDRNATRLRRIIAERDMRIDALDKELEGEKSKITSLQSSMASLLLKVEHLQLQNRMQKISSRMHTKSILMEELKIENEALKKQNKDVVDKLEMLLEEKQHETESCVVCMELPRNCVLMFCGHVCVCKLCAKKIDTCPIS